MAIVIFLTGCGENDEKEAKGEESQSKDLFTDSLKISAYFPLNQGMEFIYTGEGNELAPFTRKILHVQDNYLQLTDNNGGTIVVSIYEINEEMVSKLYTEEEFYSEENIISQVEKEKDSEEVILRIPLRDGNSWETIGEKREIVGVNQVLEIPAGIFQGVVKVKITYKDSEATGYEYFAPNIGLIKREYITEVFEVNSELSSFSLKNE